MRESSQALPKSIHYVPWATNSPRMPCNTETEERHRTRARESKHYELAAVETMLRTEREACQELATKDNWASDLGKLLHVT
ncbi:hypothetical protein OIU74_015407 [Salix koriyanagi]|uniref:Uncharacterized protein n=1 Tax=Salix koriyanagi TaxID=2511006 RepID=A0A9Q0PY16_9ROSI|nr:hypothetical protein OIU74_015407 [Salix koriyanagi]